MISLSQGQSQTPRSIATGWSFGECCIAFKSVCFKTLECSPSLHSLWQIVDGVTSLKKDRVLQLLIINTLAARQQVGSKSLNSSVLICHLHRLQMRWTQRVKRCENPVLHCKSWNAFFSQDQWKVTSATLCAEVFLYPLNSVHFPVLFKQPDWHVCDAKQQHPPSWPLDSSSCQGGGAC